MLQNCQMEGIHVIRVFAQPLELRFRKEKEGHRDSGSVTVPGSPDEWAPGLQHTSLQNLTTAQASTPPGQYKPHCSTMGYREEPGGPSVAVTG
jgi:hypothetical protein